MLHDAGENIRQRSARFASSDHVDVERSEDAREIAQRLRKAAAIDQRLMQSLRHLLDPRMFQPFLENAEALVQGHPGLQQVAKLLGKNQQLPMRDLEILRGSGPGRS